MENRIIVEYRGFELEYMEWGEIGWHFNVGDKSIYADFDLSKVKGHVDRWLKAQVKNPVEAYLLLNDYRRLGGDSLLKKVEVTSRADYDHSWIKYPDGRREKVSNKILFAYNNLSEEISDKIKALEAQVKALKVQIRAEFEAFPPVDLSKLSAPKD